MTDPTTTQDEGQHFHWTYLLQRLEQHDTFPTICPYATTTVAWSKYFKARVVVARQCNRWGCRFCGAIKSRKLAHRVKEAKPTKFITLTVNTAVFDSPRIAYEQTRRRLADLSKRIRKNFEEFEYVRVLEVTKKGWPHYHLVARCGYIPQKWLSDAWGEMTGAPIVDIRKIREHTDVYRYMMKYLAKQKYIPWTNRRISWSKYFFPKLDKQTRGKWQLCARDWENVHPYEWLNLHCYGHPCTPINASAWLIDTPYCPPPFRESRTDRKQRQDACDAQTS